MKTSHNIIIESVCDYYEITSFDLFRNTRKRSVSTPRQMYYFLCRKHTAMSFDAIRFTSSDYGKVWNHATVIHSVKKIEGYLSWNDRETSRDLAAIEDLMIKKMNLKGEIIVDDVDLLGDIKKHEKTFV